MGKTKKKPDQPATPRPEPHIVFRHLGREVAPGCTPDLDWQVEYHDGRGFPVGLAWVVVPPPGHSRPVIKFVLVADDARRRGVATRLVEACRGRWPGAELSLPVSPAGEGLHRKVCPPPAPEDVFNAGFIARQLAAGVSRAELERLAAEHRGALMPRVIGAPSADPE